MDGSRGSISTELYACSECGVVVSDCENHSRQHRSEHEDATYLHRKIVRLQEERDALLRLLDEMREQGAYVAAGVTTSNQPLPAHVDSDEDLSRCPQCFSLYVSFRGPIQALDQPTGVLPCWHPWHDQ